MKTSNIVLIEFSVDVAPDVIGTKVSDLIYENNYLMSLLVYDADVDEFIKYTSLMSMEEVNRVINGSKQEGDNLIDGFLDRMTPTTIGVEYVIDNHQSKIDSQSKVYEVVMRKLRNNNINKII